MTTILYVLLGIVAFYILIPGGILLYMYVFHTLLNKEDKEKEHFAWIEEVKRKERREEEALKKIESKGSEGYALQYYSSSRVLSKSSDTEIEAADVSAIEQMEEPQKLQKKEEKRETISCPQCGNVQYRGEWEQVQRRKYNEQGMMFYNLDWDNMGKCLNCGRDIPKKKLYSGG